MSASSDTEGKLEREEHATRSSSRTLETSSTYDVRDLQSTALGALDAVRHVHLIVHFEVVPDGPLPDEDFLGSNVHRRSSLGRHAHL